MRYKPEIKEKVRQLRKEGFSLSQISVEMSVPITTVSSWVTDIPLTSEQSKLLSERIQTALQAGRIRAQSLSREWREAKATELLNKGINDIHILNNRDFFIAGVALYWAEGFKNKHESRLGFCNSDPDMIRFYLRWLELLGIKRSQIVVRLSLNASYKDKTKEIVSFWSEITKIPENQFTKTFYQNTTWKKVFIDENYFGVLRVNVQNSLELQMKMKGWIEGLKVNLPG